MKFDDDEMDALAEKVAARLRSALEMLVANRTEYVSRAEAARRMSVSLATVDRMIRSGTLTARKPTRHGKVLVLAASLAPPDADTLAARALHGLPVGGRHG